MKLVTCIQRGESSDFWAEEDSEGNPIPDMSTGQLKGGFRVTYFNRGDVLELPDLVAANLVQLGIAVEGIQNDGDTLPPAPSAPVEA